MLNLLLGLLLWQAPAAGPITVHVDAREAARSLFHVTEHIPHAPGPVKLFYPKFIPGEHTPSGPMNSVIRMRISSGGKALPWKRDLVNMFEVDTTVPPGSNEVTIDFDQTFAIGTLFGESGSATLSRIKWNRLVWYPGPLPSDSIAVSASITLPSGWTMATALDVDKREGDTLTFKTVNLTRLVDSPGQIGRYFKSYDVTGTSPVKHTLDVLAESPSSIEPPKEMIQKIARIHEEAEAMIGARHYSHYNWLLTLSDVGGSDGLEHHESSENGVFEKSLVDPDLEFDLVDLLSHEYFHSFNGKFRRPVGLATPNFDVPMTGDLLWVYEGLTQFFGHVLPRRAGFWSDEKWREILAVDYHMMNYSKGREWRPLSDTADAVQLTYGSPKAWIHTRRGDDYYTEMVSVWLEVHSILSNLTKGQKGIDDFAREFLGGPPNGPELKTYTYNDVTAALGKIASYDWDGFFKKRVYSVQPDLTTAGFEGLGWKVVYNSTPNEIMDQAGLGFTDRDEQPLDLAGSIGLFIKKDTIDDVVPGSPSDKAGLMPEAKILAVNGRAFTLDAVRDAVAATAKGTPMEITLNNRGIVQRFTLDYKGGARYPHLERIEGRPDLLTDFGKPRRRQ
jgi:predicted metalloprotease with PDZ domain